MKKAYVLYLWLALFTMFVTVFSIILFNYSAGDIKVTRKLIKDTQYYNILEGVALIATELYRVGHISGSYSIKGKIYNFRTQRITPTTILVEVLDDNSNHLARVIVKDRLIAADMNVFTLNEVYGKELSFDDSTIYDRFMLGQDGSLSINASKKIFNIAYITPDTVVNGQGKIEEDSKGKKIYEYKNLEELKKYAHIAGFIDPQLSRFLLNYYNKLANFVAEKSFNNLTNDSKWDSNNEFVNLTKYGSILVHNLDTLKPILYIDIKFNVTNGNQRIDFDVYWQDLKDINQKINKESYTYYLVKEDQTLQAVNKGSVITNDKFIEEQIQNQNQNLINIYLNPSAGYVYKVLVKEDIMGNISKAIIYKTSYAKTIIYANAEVKIGSINQNSFDNGKIGSSILLITSKNIDILGHIVYKEFYDINDFINFSVNPINSRLNNSESYISVIAKNINISPPSNYSNKQLILNGDFIAFYDDKSETSLKTSATNLELYYLGSNITARRYTNVKEKVITDPRGENGIDQYFMYFKVLSIDILR